ncbi:MAG: TonB family protein [bacterium]
MSATVKEPVLRKKIEVQEKVEPSTPKTVTPEKKTAVKGKQKTMEETTKDGMMGLGMDTAEVEKERALAVSPAGIFTRSRLSKFLMKEPTKARLKLNVKSSGVVNKARILKSSGDVALDKVLKTLSKELRYMKAPKASVERITVQIPARR